MSSGRPLSEQPEPAFEQPDPASEQLELAWDGKWGEGDTDRWIEFPSVFYRTSSPIGSAAQKGNIDENRKTLSRNFIDGYTHYEFENNENSLSCHSDKA